MKKEVANINEIPEGMEDIFKIDNNLEGVTPRLPQIEIAHKVQLFIMPDGSKIEFFEGIIIDQQATNSYWPEKIEPGQPAKPPMCYSMDSIVPDLGSEIAQSKKCKQCPMNQFGSDGKGKACKNMKRLHILMDGSVLPRRLTVAPTSIISTNEYLTILIDMGLSYRAVLTKFSLDKVIKGDIEFSIINYKFIRKLTTTEMLVVGDLVLKNKEIFRDQEITQDEYMPQKSDPEAKYDEIDKKWKEEHQDSENLPF